MVGSETAAPAPGEQPSPTYTALVARAPWWMLPSLAIIVQAVFVFALYLAFRGDDKTLQNLMAFATVTQAAAALGFFFMSSQGSRDKDDALAVSAAAAAQSVPPETVKALLALPPPAPAVPLAPAPELKPDAPGPQPVSEPAAAESGAMRPTPVS